MYTWIPRSKTPGQKYPVFYTSSSPFGLGIKWPDIGVRVVLVAGSLEVEARGSGLHVILQETSRGKLLLRVFGKTYERRQQLRELGLRWSSRGKEWYRYYDDPVQAYDALARIINEVM